MAQAKYSGGRKSGGYSVREYLIANGVTTEQAVKKHMSLVYGTIQAKPSFDITQYRADPNNPNSVPMMG